ncbi:hypothetical protein CDD81_7703 [Ophiocordyceps australis]|uniref:Uncharacterized protein n=1 Tax=Ophiocordyceps australis TaxID=1399860 RepID=A0A2C5Y4S0_9HYPO|nr:hypothetical protein CDD81_7703 [Ophiocordyceps australis]
MHKSLLQDFKKAYGCLNSGKRHCLFLDSEGIMLRTTWIADIVKDYLANPFVIHTPESRNGSLYPIPWTTPCSQVLRIDNYDEAYARAWPQLKGNPQKVFFEVCYYAYIWAKKGSVEGPKYRFIETKRFLGQRLWDILWTHATSTKRARIPKLDSGRVACL